MDWRAISLDTYIPELPTYWNNNFAAFKRYLDVFYDETRGILIKPLETTGRVRGAKGEFTTVEVDNLIVRNQFTNLYDNITTADLDYLTTLEGEDASTRIATDASVWPYEDPSYAYINVQEPYYKISNEDPIALQYNNLSQVVGILFDTSHTYV